MNAAMGKVLRVDLGTQSMREEMLPEELYRRYLGGLGLAAALLYEAIPAGADPLGPENVLCFASGLLAGTGAVMTGRWSVSCKSPLTGGWGDANCGGTLAPAIKRCGWDAILFSGIAAEPLVFVADERGPRLEQAGELWGMDAVAAEEALLAAHAGGKKPAVAVIGPAGEALSLIAGISNDKGRYAARSGVGAVMGSKKLKALVLSGNARIACADPQAMKALAAAYVEKVKRQNLPRFFTGRLLPLMGRFLGSSTVIPVDGMMSAGVMRRWGTIFNNLAGAVNGDSPFKNWSGSIVDYGKRRLRALDPDRIIARETRKYHCHSCVIGCGGIVGGDRHQHKPEYETCCAFGPLAMADDLEAVYRCNDLCNRSGLDTISAGAAIAFAIECFEAGVIGTKDTDGLELRWGDAAAVETLLARMARREGFGAVLADGVKKAAERIGRGCEQYAIHVGGQEPGMHDPRFDPMMGVAYAADPTPGRHTISSAAYYNVARLWEFVPWAPKVGRPYLKENEYKATREEALKSVAGALLKQVLDASGGCLFALTTGLQNWRLFEMLDAATGEPRSPAEYLEAGRRIQSLRQAFNVKQGLMPRDTLLPPRIAGRPPLAQGPLAGRELPIEAMVRNYWREMGWDPETGVPPPHIQ